MPVYSAEELEKLVNDVVNAASAPVGSNLFMSTPGLIKPLIMLGDVGDGWVFTVGLCQAVLQYMGMEDVRCRCEPPDPMHRPVLGMAPVGTAGALDPDLLVLPGKEPPLEIGITNPEVVTFTKMINAVFDSDDDASVKAWEESVEGGWFARVMIFAAKTAGDIRREAVGAMGVN